MSSSTVSRWVRDIELTPAQEAVLRAANPIFNRQVSGTARAQANARARRLAAQAHGADMVALFIRFLTRCYDVPLRRVRLTVNVHLGNGVQLADVEAWWLDRLGIPGSCLLPSVVNRPSRASRMRRRTLPYGTVRVSVFSTFVVQSIYGAIQAYAGIDRPRWLD